MFVVLHIYIYDGDDRKKTSSIMTTQVFGKMHQVEQYRSDMEQYCRLQGMDDPEIFFTIKDCITFKGKTDEIHVNHSIG